MPPVSEQLKAIYGRLVALETEVALFRRGVKNLSRCVKVLWAVLAPLVTALLGRYFGVY